MDLGLSLGDSTTTAKGPFSLSENPREKSWSASSSSSSHKGHLGFCMSLSIAPHSSTDDHQDAPIQLDLLPHIPVLRNLSWSSEGATRGLDVNRAPTTSPAAVEDREGSPNSAASSFQMEFCMFRSPAGSGGNDGGADHPTERACSRGSDEDESGSNTRKKLRLSKQQSAFLEESFKEHNTLNPKLKLSLAKQLNLRPRQVEVWFQNRRARTKLKQTEVDCEYLKRCCETLTEENRRLQKELQDLRALKSTNSFYMQLPATTLTMCPSCESVAAITSSSSAAAAVAATTTTNITGEPGSTKSSGFSLITRPRPSSTPFHNSTHLSKAS